MASKRYKQRKSSIVAKAVTVGVTSLVLACCIGFGIASAGDASVDNGAFGMDDTIAASSAEDRAIVMSGDAEASDDSILATTSQRDISANVQAIEAELEAERKAAEELARAQEAERIAGTPLAGTGAIFAQAAWDNGVDPRWSPAISNTESTNGAHCFLPHNAWGWGSSSWGSWEEAINAHVAGLANVYGYSITYAAAQKYCPPNYDHWFRNTLSQMKMI